MGRTVHAIICAFCCMLSLEAAVAVQSDGLEGFPYDACDCVIEFNRSEPLFEDADRSSSLAGLIELLGGLEVATLLDESVLEGPASIRQALLSGGVIGTRSDPVKGAFEWVALIPEGPGQADAMHDIVSHIKPVLGSDRFMAPELGLSITPVENGVLISSEPSGRLRALVLSGLSEPVESEIPEARRILPSEAGLVVTMRHGPPFGGSSACAVFLSEGDLRLEYRGRFANGPDMPSPSQEALDVEVLERLPDTVIAAMIEHVDASFLPGEEVISRLLPYLVEPERSDERRTRRLVVVAEAGFGAMNDGLRLPAVAVAIEVDGPGATARRQDLQVLASLNNLRNRLGTRAGLQHLPNSDQLPEDGTRTIYTEALLDSALSGHPMARCVSVNWCHADGESCWQLYATTPELAGIVERCLKSEPGVLQCVRAHHAGRLDAASAVTHVRSWGAMADAFVGREYMTEFEGAIDVLTEALDGIDSLEWTLSIPDEDAIDASIVLRPDSGPKR